MHCRIAVLSASAVDMPLLCVVVPLRRQQARCACAAHCRGVSRCRYLPTCSSYQFPRRDCGAMPPLPELPVRQHRCCSGRSCCLQGIAGIMADAAMVEQALLSAVVLAAKTLMCSAWIADAQRLTLPCDGHAFATVVTLSLPCGPWWKRSPVWGRDCRQYTDWPPRASHFVWGPAWFTISSLGWQRELKGGLPFWSGRLWVATVTSRWSDRQSPPR